MKYYWKGGGVIDEKMLNILFNIEVSNYLMLILGKFCIKFFL